MRISDANLLLDHFYLPMESGWIRDEDGTAHVAARTHMIGCTSKMVEWWFGYLHTTEHYKWWHPRDHVFCSWEGERGTGKYVGGTHIVHEYFGGGPTLFKLKINFREPASILDTSRFAAAKVGAAIYARTGPLERPIWTGHTLHLIHDTPEGCVMRSRFWLGHIEPNQNLTDRELRDLIPNERVQGLHQHASEEMSILAGFLPTLYRMHANTV